MHILVVTQLCKCFVGLGPDLFTLQEQISQVFLPEVSSPHQFYQSLHLVKLTDIHPIHSVDGYFIPDLEEKDSR